MLKRPFELKPEYLHYIHFRTRKPNKRAIVLTYPGSNCSLLDKCSRPLKDINVDRMIPFTFKYDLRYCLADHPTLSCKCISMKCKNCFYKSSNYLNVLKYRKKILNESIQKTKSIN